MDLIQLLVVVVVAGLAFWLVQVSPWIAQPFKSIALAVIVVFVCVYLLSAVGLCSGTTLHIRH